MASSGWVGRARKGLRLRGALLPAPVAVDGRSVAARLASFADFPRIPARPPPGRF